MAIVTAKSSEADARNFDLPENEFFPVNLLEIRREASSPQYKRDKTEGSPDEWRVGYKWVTEDGNDNWVFDYTSTSLGESKAQVSMLRQLINAINGRRSGETVAWFDDETFFYGLDAEFTGKAEDKENVKKQASGRLEEGTRVQVMGVYVSKGDVNRFKVKAFKQAPGESKAGAPKSPAKQETVAVAATDPSTSVDDVDF